jgi:hypothetical protein
MWLRTSRRRSALTSKPRERPDDTPPADAFASAVRLLPILVWSTAELYSTVSRLTAPRSWQTSMNV